MEVLNRFAVSFINPLSSIHKCGNCSKECKEDDQLTTFIEVENMGKTDDILVWDAFTYIYGISWEQFQNIDMQRIKSGSSADSPTFTTTIGICQFCVSLLVQNYNAHLKFENSTDSSSVFQEIKNNCRKTLDKTSSRVPDAFPCDFNNITQPSPMEEMEYQDYSNLNSPSPHPTIIEDIKETIEKIEKDRNHFDLENETFQVQHGREPSKVKLEPCKTLVIQIERLSDTLLQFYIGKNSSRKKVLNRKKLKEKRSTRGQMKDFGTNAMEDDIQGQEIQKESFEEREMTSKKIRNNEKGSSSSPIKFVTRAVPTCCICDYQCISHSELRVHMTKHRLEKSCHICNKKYASLETLRIHVKFVHKMGRPDQLVKPCYICGKVFNSKNLITHLKVHEPREVYKCPKCPKTYMKMNVLAAHLLTHEEGFVGHVCHHCGKTLPTVFSLASHKRIHINERKFKCGICPATFKLKKGLSNHQKAHSSERPYKCEDCGAALKWKQELDRHIQRHKDEAGKEIFECEICKIVLKNGFSLYNHKLRMHSNKSYECSICGKTIENVSKLNWHTKLHKRNDSKLQS